MTTGHEKDDAENTMTADETTVETPAKPFVPRQRTVEGCSYCEQFGGSVMMPSHFASSACQSGGHNHCSCGTCF